MAYDLRAECYAAQRAMEEDIALHGQMVLYRGISSKTESPAAKVVD